MMKRHFDVKSDGFYGAYWKCKTGSDCAMNVMTMSPGKKDYGHLVQGGTKRKSNWKIIR